MTNDGHAVSADTEVQTCDIPHVIHLIWLGDKGFPPEVRRCLESWVKYLPGYKIRIWRAADALAINCLYLHQAVEEKKWAFAADVVRFYALYNEGGIYMDSDILLYKPFDNLIPAGGFATFHEHIGSKIQLQAAMMLGAKGNIICKEAFEYYCNKEFRRNDGTLDLTVSPAILADVALHHGWKKEDTLQYFGTPVQPAVAYPCHLLTPHNHAVRESEDAIGRHCIMGSWRERKSGRRIEVKVKGWVHQLSYSLTHLSKKSRTRIFDIRTYRHKYFPIN